MWGECLVCLLVVLGGFWVFGTKRPCLATRGCILVSWCLSSLQWMSSGKPCYGSFKILEPCNDLLLSSSSSSGLWSYVLMFKSLQCKIQCLSSNSWGRWIQRKMPNSASAGRCGMRDTLHSVDSAVTAVTFSRGVEWSAGGSNALMTKMLARGHMKDFTWLWWA